MTDSTSSSQFCPNCGDYAGKPAVPKLMKGGGYETCNEPCHKDEAWKGVEEGIGGVQGLASTSSPPPAGAEQLTSAQKWYDAECCPRRRK